MYRKTAGRMEDFSWEVGISVVLYPVRREFYRIMDIMTIKYQK
jgi:hypothetical protein